MQIRPLNQPQAGKQFEFMVSGGTKPTHIEVYVADEQIINSDCDDPPCHESFLVPGNARGQKVQIIARDATGDVEERTIRVTDTDTSAGGTMATAG